MNYDYFTVNHNETGKFLSPKSGMFATTFFFLADNNNRNGSVAEAGQADLNFQKKC